MGGDAALAAQVFTAAAANYSNEGSVFNNFATALATFGAESEDADLLCEAHAAGEVAQALGHTAAAELVEAIEEMLPAAGCAHHLLPRVARRQLLQGAIPVDEHIRHVRSLCAEPQTMTIRASKRESMQHTWSAAQLHKLWFLMRVCGMVILDGVLDAEVVSRFGAVQEEHAKAKTEDTPEKRYKGTDAASRGSLRQEVRLPPQLLSQHIDVIAEPLLHSAIKMLLDEQVELDTFSCIASLPGCPDQDWHNDVPTPQVRHCHLPPPGLVAVVPLVGTTPQNGATEFLPGSHVHGGDERFWMDEESKNGGGATTAVPHLQPSVPIGNLVLFDIRLRHRGRENAGDRKRTILYMSYVQNWFRDGVNFKERQTLAWDSFPERARGLLTRLDARDYVAQLEEALERHGVDMSTLRSGGGSARGQRSEL